MKKIYSDKIIEQINNDKKVIYKRTEIIGDIDFTTIKNTQKERQGDIAYRGIINADILFKECIFKGSIITHYKKGNNIYYITFKKYVGFEGCNFLDDVNFMETFFQKKVSFCRTQFSSSALFRGAKFYDGTNFNKTSFLTHTDFYHTKFYDNASFKGAYFFNNVDFENTKFFNKKNDMKYNNNLNTFPINLKDNNSEYHF